MDGGITARGCPSRVPCPAEEGGEGALAGPKEPPTLLGGRSAGQHTSPHINKDIQQRNRNMTCLLSWLGFWPSCHHNHDWCIENPKHHVIVITISVFTSIDSSSWICR